VTPGKLTAAGRAIDRRWSARSLPPRSRTSHRDRGGGAIEAALVLPLLLIMVFGVVHVAMHHLARQAALSAAQVAVAAEQGWGAVDGAGAQRAAQYLDRIPPVLREVESIDVTSDGVTVAATVTGTSISVIPWYTQRVSQTAHGPVERVTAP
jgi:Flp pilus assembly protein TadG